MPFITTISSGSSGNSAIFSDGHTHILIDAGVSFRRLREGLRQFGISEKEVSAVFITHEHSDHIKGLPLLLKRADIPVYLTAGTACYIDSKYPELSEHLRVLSAPGEVQIGEVTVTIYPTPHDAMESCGLVFQVFEHKLSYFTDLGFVTDEIRQAVVGSECIFIESNHDVMALMTGPYPPYLKRRIIGRKGHLSNDDCSALLAEAARNGACHFTLCHLSKENNTPTAAYVCASAALEKAGSNASICVAPPDSPSEPYYFEIC